MDELGLVLKIKEKSRTGPHGHGLQSPGTVQQASRVNDKVLFSTFFVCTYYKKIIQRSHPSATCTHIGYTYITEREREGDHSHF